MPEDIAEQVQEAAEISMGTEILQDDEMHIKTLAKSVVEISDYRQNLAEYLKNRMNAVAPNLTILIGELVAAKLISHAGSLMNLAKQPASTI
jgi:nucleolar protein 58